MSKYSKEEISEVYQKETHPLLDEEDRVAEKSTSEYERMVLFNDREKYEEEDLEYDDYESDGYEDNIVLEDVVYANEEDELAITDGDLVEHQLKEKIRQCLPLANNDEVSQISEYLISRYGKDNLPFDRLQQYIYGQIISKMYENIPWQKKIIIALKSYYWKIKSLLTRMWKHTNKKHKENAELMREKNEYPNDYQDSDIEYSDNEGLNEDFGNYDEEWKKVSQKQNKKHDIEDDVPF